MEVFVLPDALLADGTGHANSKRPAPRIWVVINNRVTPQFEVVEAGLIPPLSRSFSTLIKAGSSKRSLRQPVSWPRPVQSTFIDDAFSDRLKARYGSSVTPGFDAPYLTALYRYGYDKALGPSWTHEVPLSGGATLRRTPRLGARVAGR